MPYRRTGQKRKKFLSSFVLIVNFLIVLVLTAVIAVSVYYFKDTSLSFLSPRSDSKAAGKTPEDATIYGEFIVSFSTTPESISEIRRKTGFSDLTINSLGRNIYLISSVGIKTRTTRTTQSTEHTTLESTLKSSVRNIRRVTPNSMIYGLATNYFNDPRYTEQWSLPYIKYQETIQQLGSRAHQKNVVVAVIDSGINYNHEDLKNQIWINSDEILGNNKDDDRNGYVDDYYGYDFANNDGNPSDDHMHGTAVSGIISAVTNNSKGIVGICQKCRIMALKVLDKNNSGNWANIIKALNYAIDNGAIITNNSYGAAAVFNQDIQDIIYAGNSKNVIFVAAAGNDGNSMPFYPAAYDKVIAVSALDRDTLINGSMVIPTYSNYGSWVDIAAPGTGMITTSGKFGESNSSYISLGGTSFASPVVTGVIGLVLSSTNYPTNPDQLSKLLVDSITPFDKSSLARYGKGVINAQRTIFNALTYNPNATPICQPGGGISPDIYCPPSSAY